MKKRAQLTLMIITGIVLLFAVALVIWLGSQATTRRTAPEAEHQRLRQVAVEPVRDYIQSCLDIVTSTALDLLGKQGGVLYRNQGGLTRDVNPATDIGSRYVPYPLGPEGYNVSYDIVQPAGNIDALYYAQPSEYPWPLFPYIVNGSNPGQVIKTQYTGYFGESKLAPLFKPGKESIQEQIESYVNTNLPRCTNWGTFKSQGLSIVAGEPNASVFIAGNVTQIKTEQFFSVFADWQVNVTDLTTGGNTTLERFSLSYPVHLAKLYLLVQGIVNAEVSDATFDPRSASTPATPVTVIEAYMNPNDKGGDDIIVVQDSESQLRGKPFEFRILRKNRLPALVHINQTDLDRYKFIAALGKCKDTDTIFLDAEGNLQIKWGDPNDWSTTLQAFDPDEDAVSFRTLPPAPTKLSVNHAGEIFRLFVYVSDGGTVEDFQVVNLLTRDCPP